MVDAIGNLTGLFFGGGDQQRLLFCFNLNYNSTNPNRSPSPALLAIWSRFQEGMVIGGTSAGTDILQGAPMIEGGASFNALVNGSHVVGSPACAEESWNQNCYEPYGGLGFFPAELGLLDTHYGVRGRFARSINLAYTVGNVSFVYGVDENSAVIFTNVGTGDDACFSLYNLCLLT